MNHYAHYTKKQKNHQTRIQKIYFIYIYIYESSNPYCTKEEEEEVEKKKKHQQQQRRRRRCSGEEEEPIATAGRRRKSRTAAAVAVKKKQSSSSGGNMAERGVRGNRFDLRPTSKKQVCVCVSTTMIPFYMYKWKWKTRIQLSPTRNEFSTIHATNFTTFSTVPVFSF